MQVLQEELVMGGKKQTHQLLLKRFLGDSDLVDSVVAAHSHVLGREIFQVREEECVAVRS